MPKLRSNIIHRPILYAILWIEGYCQHIRIHSRLLTNVGILQFTLFWLTTSLIQGLFLLDLLHIVLDTYQNCIPWVDYCQICFNSLPSPYTEHHNNSCAQNPKIQIHLSPWITGPKRCPRCQWKAYFKTIKLMKRCQRKSRVNTHFVTHECTLIWQQASGKGHFCSTQKLPNFPQYFAQNTYFSHCIPPLHATVTQILWTQCAQV
jgi:hypothetical protein